MKTKPNQSFWALWNLSFGFFGVQIAYALQSANVSRIFATLGADPHDLSYFWILPPLMGLIVQPIVGTASDHTWNRFGRRLPYLIFGALIAIIVMCLLPNAGSFGLGVSSAIIVGLIALMMLDTSINMAMQPFKMLVGDMVNEKQKGLAYSIQSFLCNAGSIVGYVFPFLLTWIGFRNTAAEGVIPQTVVFSFYIGAAILLICVIYSLAKIKEWPPELYAEYNGGGNTEGKAEKNNLFQLLIKAPSTFWTVGLVQFFCWFAFLFMWTYTNGTIARTAFDTPEAIKIHGIEYKGKSFDAKYVLNSDKQPIIMNGKAVAAGFEGSNGVFYPAKSVEILSKNNQAKYLIEASMVHTSNGIQDVDFDTPVDVKGSIVVIDGTHKIDSLSSITLKTVLSQMKGSNNIILCDIYTHDPHTGELYTEGDKVIDIPEISQATFSQSIELNTESDQYNAAGNWVGILFAVQAIGSVLWAVMLPRFRSRKFSYTLSLILGAIGFISVGIIENQYLLFVSFLLIGCAWAAMLAWPFTILTNSLKGGNIGAYLGLFNCSICIPQIIGAITGGPILSLFTKPGEVAPQEMMMIIAGISLVIGSICVFFIRESSSEAQAPILIDNDQA